MAFQTPNNLGTPISSIEFSESVRPAGKYRPAPWLPLKRYDQRANEWVVLYSGSPVASVRPVDTAGADAGFTDLIPAGYAVQLRDTAVADGDTIFTYNDTDLENGVIDVTTGAKLAAGYTAAVTKAALIEALSGLPAVDWAIGPIAAGSLVLSSVGGIYYTPGGGTAAVNDSDLLGGSDTGIGDYEVVGVPGYDSYPIGILAYNAYRFPGGDGANPNGFQFDNWAFQDQVAFTTDYVVEVPAIAGEQLVDVTDITALVAATNPVTITATNIEVSAPYTVYINGRNVTSDVTSISAVQVTFGTNGVDDGDEVRVEYTSTAFPTALLPGAPVFALGTTSDKVESGTFVKVDGSNRFVAVTSTDILNSPSVMAEVIGQVVGVDATVERGLLSRVRTFYQNGQLAGSLSNLYSMPGSATGGKNGNLYRALGTAFNGSVRINLLK
jgi:hypothetical protein